MTAAVLTLDTATDEGRKERAEGVTRAPKSVLYVAETRTQVTITVLSTLFSLLSSFSPLPCFFFWLLSPPPSRPYPVSFSASCPFVRAAVIGSA